jgi:hypothetical protein
MRLITEECAKTILEVLREQITLLKSTPNRGLKVENKMRLMLLAVSEIEARRVVKNSKH